MMHHLGDGGTGIDNKCRVPCTRRPPSDRERQPTSGLEPIAMQAGRVVFDGPSVALTNERLKEIYGSASEELVLPDAADLNGLVAVAA